MLVACSNNAASPEAGAALAKQATEAAHHAAALAFFQLIAGDKNYDAARAYAGDYAQHDPNVAEDGIEATIAFLSSDPFFSARPAQAIPVHNVIADGDLVSFQVFYEADAEAIRRRMVQHTFRFDEAGGIAEHWSVTQLVDPATSPNPHPLW